MESSKTPQVIKVPPEGVTILGPRQLEIFIPSQGSAFTVKKPLKCIYEGHKIDGERITTINFETDVLKSSSVLRFCYPDAQTVVVLKEGEIPQNGWGKVVTFYTDTTHTEKKRVERFYPGQEMTEVIHSNKPFETKAGGFSVTAYLVERRYADGKEEYGAFCDDPRPDHHGEIIYRPFKGGRGEFYKKIKGILRQQSPPISLPPSEQRTPINIVDVPGGMIVHYDDRTEERTFDDHIETLEHSAMRELVINKGGKDILVEAVPYTWTERVTGEKRLYWEYTDLETGKVGHEHREPEQPSESAFFQALVDQEVIPGGLQTEQPFGRDNNDK